MITKQFNHISNILEVTYSGEIDIKQILDYQNEIFLDTSFPRKLMIFTNASNSKIVLSTKEVDEVALAIEDLMSKYTLIKNAFLTDSPLPTALSTLYKLSVASFPTYQFDVFSSKKAAQKFLL